MGELSAFFRHAKDFRFRVFFFIGRRPFEQSLGHVLVGRKIVTTAVSRRKVNRRPIARTRSHSVGATWLDGSYPGRGLWRSFVR
jgi:hypothetical protein